MKHTSLYLALAATPLVVAIGFSWGLAIRRSDTLELGTVGELVGAVATTAAVIVALWVAIGDSRRREAERKEQQAAQARLITVERTEDATGGAFYVKVTNHSASPVFAVVVEAVHVTPDPLRVRFFGKRSWPRLDAGKSVGAKAATFKMDGTALANVTGRSVVAADISFVDSAGLRWRRWGGTPPRGGAPIERREPPQPVPEVKQEPLIDED